MVAFGSIRVSFRLFMPDDRKLPEKPQASRQRNHAGKCHRVRGANAGGEAAREQEVPTLQNTFTYTPQKTDLPKFTKLSAKVREDLQALFSHTERDVGFVSHEAKWKWTRLRPFIRNKELHPCIKRESSYAYPSGHAAFGSSGARLLSEIFPRYAAAFKKASDEIGQNRIVGGVHHASDIQAGYVIGEKALESLRKNPQFAVDLEAVKKEVAAERFR